MSTRALLALCILLAIGGWVAVGLFTYYNPPDALNRWIALALLWPTLLASCLPLVYSIHLRRGGKGTVAAPLARQSAFAATYLTLCLWLRMIQALNWANMLLMLLLFVATEALLSARQT
jgi:cation transport ATPase